jgi:hypothetical protein
MVIRQKRRDLAAQIGVALAGFPQPGIAFGWIAPQCLLEERFNLLPAFHAPS